MRIIALSDTHNKLKKITIPDGDILIHAGDLTGRGEVWEIEAQLDELAKYNDRFNDTILIAGNHDWLAEKNPAEMRRLCVERDLTYLDNSGVDLNGVKVWGSPWTPWFYSWAFNARRTEEEQKAFGGPWIKDIWDTIPLDTNILITHGPPAMILDEVLLPDGSSYEPPRRVGCEELAEAVKRLPNLKHHIFGHIHSSNGHLEINGVNFHNVSICGESYAVDYEPKVIIYETK